MMIKNVLYWLSIILLALTVYLIVWQRDSGFWFQTAAVTTAFGFAMNVFAYYLLRREGY